MRNITKKEIEQIFYANKGYSRAKDITSKGINKYHLKKLEAEGTITKIKRGLYKWNDYDFSSEYAEVSKIVPEGVVCLTSALSFYELTSYNPWQYEVAIRMNYRKPVLPEYPPIKIVFFSKEQYESGVSEINMDGDNIKIYNMEKTVCDCIRYRNKIGMDIVKEGIKEYLKRTDKDIDKLLKYARICRVKGIVEEYVRVLL